MWWTIKYELEKFWGEFRCAFGVHDLEWKSYTRHGREAYREGTCTRCGYVNTQIIMEDGND